MAERNLKDATIFIGTPYAVNVRDVLRTGIYREILTSGARVVILCPAADDPAFIEEFSGPNVHLEKLVTHKPEPSEVRFDTLRFMVFSDLTRSIGMRADPTRPRSLPKRVAISSLKQTTKVLGRARTEAALAWLQRMVYPDRYYGQLFRKYQPDLVCLTRPFDLQGDMTLLKRAAAERVPTLVLVASWDNLTSKGMFPARVDRLAVWSEIMKEEAVELHRYAPDQVYIGGVPQFDLYADHAAIPDRQTLFKRIGADPSKRLITFTLTIEVTFPRELEVATMLYRAMRSGAIHPASQMLIRMHPQAPRELPPELKNQPDVLVEVPGKSKGLPHRDLDREDILHLAALMKHSDVVVNSASTTCIDAAVFDTPVVCVGFDGTATDLPLHLSVRRRYEHTHIQKLLKTDGVRLGRTLEQTIELINAYLADRSIDADGRQRLVAQQCGVIDGKAGQRIGRYVVDSLAHFRARRRADRPSRAAPFTSTAAPRPGD